MKKKWILVLVTVLFALTACNTNSKSSGESKEAEVLPSVAEESEVEYSKGILKENSWESKWMGLRFTAPEGMEMATQEELNEMMGFTAEAISDDFSEAQIEYVEMSTVHEMMCLSSDAITHAVVAVEKLSAPTDMDTYLKAMENTLSQVSVLTFSVLDSDEVVSVGGWEFRKMRCVASFEGIELYQDYLLRIKDDRVISIIGTYLDESSFEKILSGFEAY